MPIEFNCPQCARLLRTPDESEGKQAKCPQCSAIVDIPAAGSVPKEPSPSTGHSPFGKEPDSATFDANPYASPTAASQIEAAAPAKGELQHSLITFDGILKSTWDLFRENLGEVALLGVVLFAFYIGHMVFQLGISFAAELTGEPAFTFGASFISNFVQLVLQTFLSVGCVLYMTKLMRSRQAELKDLFAVGPYFLKCFGLSLLILLLALLGLAICFAPGVIAMALQLQPEVPILLFVLGGVIFVVAGASLWLRYIISFYFVVDRGCGIMESLHESARYMQGNRITTFLLLIVVGFVGPFFVCATCCVGYIFYIPYVALLFCVIYMTATGQPYRHGVG
jgi:hypothetical protein